MLPVHEMELFKDKLDLTRTLLEIELFMRLLDGQYVQAKIKRLIELALIEK